MGVKFESDGKNVNLNELLKKFKDLPDNLTTNALKAGVRAAATAVKKEALTLVPRKTGALAKTITVKLRRTNNKGIIRFSVAAGDRSKRVFYAHMVEFGVSPHLIQLYKINYKGHKLHKKVLTDKNVIYGTEVSHTGFKQKPFMRPALDAKEGEIIPIIAAKITERLDKLAQGKA